MMFRTSMDFVVGAGAFLRSQESRKNLNAEFDHSG